VASALEQRDLVRRTNEVNVHGYLPEGGTDR